MNADQAMPSQSDYLKESDLNGRDFTLTVRDVTLETVGSDDRLVVYFAECQKSLVLNQTNKNTIKGLYGVETDNWIGQKITLGPDETEFQGRRVACIRVRLRVAGAVPAPAAAAPAAMPAAAAVAAPETPATGAALPGETHPDTGENLPF